MIKKGKKEKEGRRDDNKRVIERERGVTAEPQTVGNGHPLVALLKNLPLKVNHLNFNCIKVYVIECD